jgi:hypothetical protein
VHFAYLPPRIAKRHISNFCYFHMVRRCKVLSPRILSDPKHLVRGRRLARGRSIWGSPDTSQRFAVLLGSGKRPCATFKFRISGTGLEAASPNLPPQAGWAVPSCVPLRGKLIKSLIEHKAQRYAGQSRQTPSLSASPSGVSTLGFQVSNFRCSIEMSVAFLPSSPKEEKVEEGSRLEPQLRRNWNAPILRGRGGPVGQ